MPPVCIRCATAVAEHIDKQDERGQIKVTVCSSASREAVECYVASPPARFDAPRQKDIRCSSAEWDQHLNAADVDVALAARSDAGLAARGGSTNSRQVELGTP